MRWINHGPRKLLSNSSAGGELIAAACSRLEKGEDGKVTITNRYQENNSL